MKHVNRSSRSLVRSNRRLARELWGDEIQQRHLRALRDLTERFGFAIGRGEVRLLAGNWYVTHAGLLGMANRNRCSSIRVHLVPDYCDRQANHWVFKAMVYKSPASKAFVSYGDADPSNVSPLVRGAEMRIAETRAVNRALRKAYGIGLCSVEELGSFSSPDKPPAATPRSSGHAGLNGSSSGQPRLRDQLCLLIRQHNLDPNLVKAYAADFCGTQTLKDASRDLVESFIAQLTAFAKKDRDGLICKLNSYARPVEATT